MSSGKSEEEARLLDQKIAEIRRKNEALLKRRQEIEEDKKLAEKRNAVVQLKPTSIEDWPRERTPALRPSNRDVLGGGGGGDSLPKQAQFDSPIPRGGSRGGKSRRGEDLIGKGAGPPPDPRSFLADPDRDPVDYKERPDKSGRSDAFGQGSPGVREYQRGGGARGRGGRGGRRGDSGRRGDHSSPYTRNDEAWREERHKIDEARIQRQKCADGKWRREWDNEKLEFELEVKDNKHPVVTSPRGGTGGASSRLDRWKTAPPQDPKYEDPRGSGDSFVRGRGAGSGRGYRVHPENSPSGRGRGRFNSPPDTFRFAKQQAVQPTENPGYRNPRWQTQEPSPTFERTVMTEAGGSFKVVVSNKDSDGDEKIAKDRPPRRGRRDQRNRRNREKLRTSRSSYSEEDEEGADVSKRTPKSKTSFEYENVSFTISNDSEKAGTTRPSLKTSNEVDAADKELKDSMRSDEFFEACKSAKPPLPPFRSAGLTSPEYKDAEEGESWEDVTTSGTESFGEDCCSSVAPSPNRIARTEGRLTPTDPVEGKDPADIYTPDDFIVLVQPVDGSPKKVDIARAGSVSEDEELTIRGTPDDFIRLVRPDDSSLVFSEENIASSHKSNVFHQEDSALSNLSMIEKEEKVSVDQPDVESQKIVTSEVIKENLSCNKEEKTVVLLSKVEK